MMNSICAIGGCVRLVGGTSANRFVKTREEHLKAARAKGIDSAGNSLVSLISRRISNVLFDC